MLEPVSDPQPGDFIYHQIESASKIYSNAQEKEMFYPITSMEAKDKLYTVKTNFRNDGRTTDLDIQLPKKSMIGPPKLNRIVASSTDEDAVSLEDQFKIMRFMETLGIQLQRNQKLESKIFVNFE